MGDIFKRMARLGLSSSDYTNDLIWFFHYRQETKYSKAVKEMKSLSWVIYQLSKDIKMTSKAKPKATTKKQLETHWASMDVRHPDEKARVIEFMSNADNVLAGVLDILMAEGNITFKPNDDGSFVGFAFLPVKHTHYSSIGLRAESKDPYKMFGVLAYKYTIMLPEYELPDVDAEGDDFR